MNKCLLFDCDGTLVDSERLCNLALSHKFEDYGVKLDADELVAEFCGWKLTTTLEALQDRHSVVLADDFIKNYRALVASYFRSELKPIANIEYALDRLPHPKAVVSNGPPEKIALALDVCGLAKYFGSNIYSAFDVGIWKPDPEIYRHAAKGMGFSPDECAIIDDGLVGAESGSKAGIPTYFYNRYGHNCEFPGVVSFDSMKQLPDLVER